MPPALLTSDVHLSPEHGRSTSRALAGLISEHRGADVHLVGDIFDLSLTPADGQPAHTLGRILAAHEEWVAACRQHLAAGGRLSFVTGNHDADLGEPPMAAVLHSVLQPPDDRQLSVSPWFHRHGSVHIEHGHVYDPDCAPNHPLSPADARTEAPATRSSLLTRMT
jgi:UDP-2,3-diacylglucosamine pyrophosphatase LpxH